MTLQFDTLSFAKRLIEAGERPEVAEAHAFTLKDFVMDNLATKTDLKAAETALRSDLAAAETALRSDLAATEGRLRSELQSTAASIRSDMKAIETNLRSDMKAIETRLDGKIDTRVDLLHKDIEAMGLKLSVRMGGMLVVAVGVLATLNKLL